MANQVNRVSEAMGRATLAARRGDMNAARSYSADAARSRAELQQMQEAQEAQALRSNTTPLAQTANKLDKTYENINDKANQTIARAQAGQSGLGKTASDVIVAGTQMLGDAPANLIVPGGSLMMMGARSFGDASQQARLNGANVGEQFGYGIGNAAVEVVSEKLFDGLAGLYGKGGADEVVEKVINRLAKTAKGQNVLKVLSSMGGEALEEVFSGALDPAFESIYRHNNARDNYGPETAAEIAYSALIGGILGGLGGSVDFAKGNVSELDTTPRKLDGSPIVTRTAQTDSAPRMLNGQPIAPRTAAQTSTDTTDTTGANLNAKNAPNGAENSRRLTDADLPDYLKAGTRRNINKSNLLESGKSIILTTTQAIQNYIKSAIRGNESGRTVAYGRVNQRLADEVGGQSKGKINITDAFLEFVPDDLQHSYEQHHVAKEQGDIPLTEDDYLSLPEYLDNYDDLIYAIQYPSGKTNICVGKHLPNGKIVIIETASKSRGALQFKNAIGVSDSKYQSNYLDEYVKDRSNTRGSESSNISLRDDTVSTNSIPGAAPKVNMENAAKPDTLPLMLNGQPIAPQGTQTDTSGPQGTEADRAPRMLDGTPIGTTAENTLTRDSIPVKAQQYLSKAENAMLRNIKNALGVDRFADRADLKDAVQRMSAEYLETGKVSPETREQLFNEAYERGRVMDTELYDQYKDIKNYIRTTPVSINEEYAQDIPDFADWRKAAFGTMRISADGTPVDIVYQELHDMAPELFPGSIMAESDQLQRIYEVGKMIRRIETNLNETYGDQSEDFKRWAKNDFDAAIDASIAELNRVRRYAQERAERKTAPAITEQNVAYAFSQIRDARHTMERAKAKNLLTDYDEGQVGRLLRGEITLDDLDANKVNVKGVREVYEASRAYDRYAETIREYNKQRKAGLLEEADGLLETANSWNDKKAGILYSRETMERNIRDIVPDRAIANAINEKYFTPVHEAEAEGNKFKNEYRDRVRSLDLSRDVAEGNVVSEAHAVQLLGEASDNLQMLNEKGKYGETRDGKTAQEWEAAIRELWEQNPNLDRAKIENAVKEFRVIYDELFERMNEVRVRNGYEPVGYRQGYFPHFQPGETEGTMALFANALGLDINVNTLPTSINGLTHTFRPGITWFGNAQERLGFDTAYDAVEGFDKYIEGVSDVVHQTDNIQRLRALATQIRYRTTDEGMRQQMDAIRSNQNLNEDEQRTKLDELYDKGRFTLGNFVVELEEYTNLLANKKSRADRDMEQRMGRQAYTAMKNLESRVAANMVAVNPGSWLTNFIPLTQAWATLDTKTLLQGMAQTLAAYKNDDGMVARSAFLTNRRGSDPIVKTWAQKASAKMSAPMEYIDQFTADTLVRARYAQNIKSGLSEENAIREADSWAAGIMADRSKGSMPTIFNRSNPVTKIFTQFQLEVNNEFSNIFKDVPDELKKKGTAALAAGLLKYFVGAWLYNEVYEYFVGRRAAFDPLDITNDFVGDLTGYQLPNTIEGVKGLFRGEGADIFKTEKAGAYGTLENLAKNVAEELPFIGGVLGGGRVPISSALPNWENLAKAAVNDQWDDRKRWSTAAKELGKPATYLALPFGGGQLRKIYQGIKAIKEGGSYSVDSQGRDILQYPVFNDTAGEIADSTARALLFGKSSLPEARKWVDSGFDSLGATQTAVYQGMNEAGVSDRDAYALLRQMENAPRGEGESADTAKRHVLQASDISGEGKSVAYYGLLASDKEQALMDSMPEGTDMGAVTETLMRFRDGNLLDGAEAKRAKLGALLDSDLMETEKRAMYRNLVGDGHEDALDELAGYGLGVDDWMRYESGAAGLSKKEEKLGVIDAMDLTNEQKDALYFAAGYKESTLKDAPWHTGEISNSQAPAEPGFNESLPIDQQLRALSSTMSESEYGKVQAGVSVGVAPADYVTLLETLPGVDDGNGTYSQAEVKAAIDAMDAAKSTTYGKLSIGGLSTEQKAALWQMANKGWKAKNNPYSVRVGQQVYDAIHGIVIENPPQTLYAAPDVSNMSALDRILASKGTP